MKEINRRKLGSHTKLATGAFEFSSSLYVITTVFVEMNQ